MGMFSRFYAVIRSNLNSVLNKAEDPSKLLETTIQDMQSSFNSAKDQVARSIADQKRLEQEQHKESREAETWHGRAVLAIEKGDDALAKQALARKAEHAQRATQFAHELERHTQNVQVLKQSLQDLSAKITEIKNKKNLIISRQKRAKAQSQIYETISGIEDTGAIDTIERMEEKVDEMSRVADARMELRDEFSGDQLAKQFQELGQNDVDTELLELKQQLRLENNSTSQKTSGKA